MSKNSLNDPYKDPFKTAQKLRETATYVQSLRIPEMGKQKSSDDIAEELRVLADSFHQEHDNRQQARTKMAYTASKKPTIKTNLLPH